MATPQILQSERDILMWKSLFEIPGDRGNVKSRGKEIEAKIEFLESLNGKVSNRRSRRWLNDRLLMELVPPLNAEEIRGLFAPPPWGDEVPPSPFSLTNTGDWDKFRTIDMDKEASMIEVLEGPKNGEKNRGNADKVAVLTAWHRVDCRTREVLRRSFHSDLVKGYEEKLRTFIKDDGDGAALVLHVQDPFRRLLLHGLCEFYDLVSMTETTKSEGRDSLKITRIKKKKKKAEGVIVLPNITLCNFLSMAKQGKW